MHRILTIPELLHLIFGEIDADEGRLLLALALTCRAFKEPALDCLWASPDGLANLVEVLPTDLWRVSKENPKILRLRSPVRPTTEVDWERFDLYARRVRGLYLRATTRWIKSRVLSGKLFRWLVSSRPHHQLLPNLSFLSCASDVPAEVHDSVYTLFCPRLAKLDVQRWSERPVPGNVSTTLLHLPQRSPNIRTLTVTMPRNGEPIPGGIFASLKRLKKLRLHASVMFHVFVELSSLPNLVDLELDIDRHSRAIVGQTAEERTAPGLTFCALEHLTLGMPITAANALLSACRFPRLQRIDVTTQSVTASTSLDRTFQLIHEHCNHTHLDTIWIESGEHALPHEVGREAITAVSLECLCDFRRLCCCVIMTWELCIILNDESVKKMAMSWPRLEDLTLRNLVTHPWAIPTATTLEGLAHLARFCPLLNELSIDIQTADTIVSANVKPGGGFCNRALLAVEFNQSPALGNCAKIAAFLHAIFPNLWEINYIDGEVRGETWRPVVEVLEVLQFASRWEKHT
ncbi:uncharacterized protein C8Q71DRAFT_156871 [Rhodofomes roseus]|uniref:F-box domain-containing protein n=1 Tax=Rhodofomes roseus TaxID=34475 RepID=A0ABQ8K9T4_9APHY|nr:uncharacterized protein C8Q71DRAFT_156871 [Rhodofomes roseus]KAH9834022.1 hypothetical protein C8Q71DRAFT_156871 [Rhodofomes roseus]